MRFLLDANIVIAFQSAGMLSALISAAARAPLLISEIVLREITDVNRGQTQLARERLKEAAQHLPGPLVVERSEAGSPVAQTYAELRNRRNDKSQRLQRDRGEDESLALALHDDGICLVCHDGAAFMAAVNELSSERALTFHHFLRRLVEHDALTLTDADAVATAVAACKAVDRSRDQSWALPRWWRGWVAARAGSSAGGS